MNDESWYLTVKERCWVALGLGLLLFAMDWSGYKRGEPDLFFPRPIQEVWWHLPVAVAYSFVGLEMVRLLDWVEHRPWPYWIAYIVGLIAVVTAGVWLVVRLASSL
jgi:high-affinity Fe2+/Pb2+ permease